MNKKVYKKHKAYNYKFYFIIICFFLRILCILYKNVGTILLKNTKVIKIKKKLLHIFHKNGIVYIQNENVTGSATENDFKK